MSSVEPFRRLVKLVARAFYGDDFSDKSSNKKAEKADNRGIAIVVLDALTRRQWMKEDELARQLHLDRKQLKRALKQLEDELLISREHRKESSRSKRQKTDGTAVEGGGGEGGYGQRDKAKQGSLSYCCLDYPQIFDVVRYRIHRAKKMIKDELDSRKVEMELLCPNASCGQRYSTLDMGRLLDPVDCNAKCERCSSELIFEADKIAQETMGAGESGGDDNARRRRREMLKDMLARMEKQLKPLMEQLARVKDLTPPYFGTLAEWESKATPAQRAQAVGGDLAAALNLPRASGSYQSSSVPLPFVGETKVEITMGASASAEDEAGKKKTGAQKVIPAWAIREGMKLTAAQRGVDVKQEVDEGMETGEVKEEIRTTEEEEEHRRVQEYYAAYMAAYMQQQQQQAQVQELSVAPSPVVKVEAIPGEQEGAEEEGVEWEDESGENAGVAGVEVKGEVVVKEEVGGLEEEAEWEGEVPEEVVPNGEDEDGVEWDDG